MSQTKNYGIVSSLALDPIEKKPLYHFFPGSKILSVGSYGCNMHCPFCQNHIIAHPIDDDFEKEYLSPQNLLKLAIQYREQGNIGVAFTYNEPLMTYDYIRDCGKLLKDEGLKVVVVTNGCFGDKVLEEILPVVDAFNIDLKTFSKDNYKKLGGDLGKVKAFIEKVYKGAHVELTTLIVPGISDSIWDMEKEAQYIASLSEEIPLHISRFFPRYKVQDSSPTDIDLMVSLKQVAEKYLKNVHLGNV